MKKRRNNEEILEEISTREVVNAKKSPKDVTVACVFSCPGHEESITGEFLSGRTGDNFIKLISILNQSLPELFPKTDKSGYYIDNSSNHIYYENYIGKTDKRTTPYILDIKSIENVDRLKEYLSQMKIIICFGKDAELALEQTGLQHINALCHLGTKGLKTISGKSLDEKINVIAKDLVTKLNAFKQ